MLRQNSNAPRAKWSMVLHDLRFKPTMYASRLGESQASLVPQEEHAQLKMPLLPGRIDQWSGWNAFCLAVPACRV